MFDAGKVKIAPWQSEADAVNYLLEARYHRDQVRNVPNYRISWSTNQTERRFGTYHVYYMEHIFLREERGELEVPKYPNFPDTWVLEKFIYAPIEEIPETRNGHYEILYPFLSPKKEPLEPLFRVCEIIIFALEHPQNPLELLNYLTDRDKKLFDSEVAYFKDVLDEENRSWIWTDPKAVVVVPRNYESKIMPGTIGITK
ncbi:MAG TPA: hypothetical protein VFS84_05275 [Candidatus Binatia bacterium]|nr:hypothetical protein [Candidatus Binatia bacterium]